MDEDVYVGLGLCSLGMLDALVGYGKENDSSAWGFYVQWAVIMVARWYGKMEGSLFHS